MKNSGILLSILVLAACSVERPEVIGDQSSAVAAALPINITGCDAETSFQLREDRDVLISAYSHGVLHAHPGTALKVKVAVDGIQCLEAVIGRNSHVHDGGTSGSCSIVARRGKIIRVKFTTERAVAAICRGGSLKIEFRPPDIYGDIDATAFGFTTVQSMNEHEINLSGFVKGGAWRGRGAGYISSEVNVDDTDVCVKVPATPVAVAGTSVAIACNRLLEANRRQKYQIVVDQSQADAMRAVFKLAPT